MQAPQTPVPTPPPGGDALGRWVAFIGLLTAAGVGAWAVLRFFGHPFLIWAHTTIHEFAYRKERAVALEQAKRIDLLLDREFPDLFRQVIDMRLDLEEHQKALATFAETSVSVRGVEQTAARLERAMGDLGDNIVKVMREVSEIRGAQRSQGGFPG